MKRKIVFTLLIILLMVCLALISVACIEEEQQEPQNPNFATVDEVTGSYENNGFKVKKVRETDAEYKLLAVLKVSKNSSREDGGYVYIFNENAPYAQLDVPKTEGAYYSCGNTKISNLTLFNIKKPSVTEAKKIIEPLKELWDSKNAEAKHVFKDDEMPQNVTLKMAEKPQETTLLLFGENNFDFMAPYAGTYEFKVSAENEFSLESADVFESGKDVFITKELKQYEKTTFKLSSDTDKLKCDILVRPQALSLGENSINLNDQYVLTSFKPDKRLHYEFSFPSESESVYGYMVVENFDFIHQIESFMGMSAEFLFQPNETYLILVSFRGEAVGNQLNLNITDKKYIHFGDWLEEDVSVMTEDVPFELPTPELVGREFLGWKNNSGEYVDEAWLRTYDSPDVYLYPAIKDIVYTITYLDADGTYIGEKTYTIISGYFDLLAPTKPDKVFLGWYESDDFSGEALFKWLSYERIGNITLYAKWANEQYTINLDVNSAESGGVAAEIEYASKTVNYNEHFTLPVLKSPSPGYYFRGWYSKETGQQFASMYGESYVPYTQLKDVTLFAMWVS